MTQEAISSSDRKLIIKKYIGLIHYHWECCGKRWTEAELAQHRQNDHDLRGQYNAPCEPCTPTPA